LPNADKFEQALDPSCSGRREGQRWAEALADAEAKAQRHRGDILVTPELSEQMSQPAAEIKASVAAADAADADLVMAQKAEPPTPVLDANGVELNLTAATAAPSRATSSIDLEAEETRAAHYDLSQARSRSRRVPTER
jgi:hypothetical protein